MSNKKECVAENGESCPACKSEEIEGDSFEVTYGYAYQPMYCIDCSNSWTNTYKLIEG